MRLIFAGTPEFAAVALRRLCEAGFDVPLVLTQPDRPAGRGMKLQASPVKEYAQKRGITVCQPHSLRLDGRFAADAATAREAIIAARADAMVVAAYGLILPQWVLDAMRDQASGAAGLGCLNIHASLLPRWRGAAPIHRAIEAGDSRSGVCIMQMDAGLDTGGVLARAAIAIRHDGPDADTTGRLHDSLAVLGADLIVQVLDVARQGPLQAQPQPDVGVTYAEKVQKSGAQVDWSRSAWQIGCAIRAFDPTPGAWTPFGNEVLKLWQAAPDDAVVPAGALPGTVLSADEIGIVIACGQGALRITSLQRAGARRMASGDFLRGLPLPVGSRLGPQQSAG
ncbi:MAG: methionyl-tRNA formyltransferase [Burkholderiaceae bacterium]